MHQIKIDLVEPQLLEAGVERLPDSIRCKVFVPDFCGDMQILARDVGGGNRGADRLLIAIHFRGVDMAIAQRQRALDRGAAGIALHAEGAEPESRQADALGLQMIHEFPLKMPMAPEARRHWPSLQGVGAKMKRDHVCVYFTRSAPILHTAASWSPVPPLQPIAPISLPPSTSGKPPGLATSMGSSVAT